MADVTSTAKLVVTVEGEDKIRKLIADLKKLGATAGTKKIGLGAGTAGLAAQAAATRSIVKSSLAPALAASAATAKLVKPLAQQQAALAKTVAPLVAGQVAVAKMAEAMTPPSKADIAKSMLNAQAALAAVKARKPEIYPEQVAGAAGLTDKFLNSLRKRGATGTDEELRARFTQPPATAVPFNKKELAERAARGLPPVGAGAAGLAEGAGAGAGMGGLARLGVGVGLVGIVGGATVALGALAAATAAVSVGAWAAVKGLDAASKVSKNIWDNMGRAKAAGKTVDELADRDALRDQLFGPKAAGLENKLPRLLTEQKRKKGIAGDKGIFGTLGLDRKTLAEMEKKGEADATGVLTRIGDKRAELEEKIAAARAPKQKAQLEQRLRAFDKSMNLFVGKPLADMVRGLPKGEAQKFSDQLKSVSESFDKVTPKLKPGELERQASAMQRAEFIRDQIAKKRDETIGRITTPAAINLQEAKNRVDQALSPAFAGIVGNIGRLGLDLQAKMLNMLPVDAIKGKMEAVNQYLSDLKVEQIPAELGKLGTMITDALKGGLQSAIDNQKALWTELPGQLFEGLKGGFQSALDNQKALWTELPGQLFEGLKGGFQSAIDNQKALWGDLGSQISDGITGMINKIRSFLGLKPLETDKEKADREKGAEKLPEVPVTPVPPDLKPLPEPGGVPGDEFGDLRQKAAEAGGEFTSVVQSGIGEAGSTGGNAFSTAASAGLSTAGTAAGGAFNSAVNASSIGAQIGAAAAAAISAAKVNVNVNVAGAGGGGGKPSTGPDTPSGD